MMDGLKLEMHLPSLRTGYAPLFVRVLESLILGFGLVQTKNKSLVPLLTRIEMTYFCTLTEQCQYISL
jgi:hypothetical protein